jgi:hypothetical protein
VPRAVALSFNFSEGFQNLMAGYKQPTFQERTAAAAQARGKALADLKARPAPDPAEVARRTAEREAREAAKREKREAAEAARAAERARAEQERAEQERIERERAEQLAAAEAANKKPELTEAERKATRDAKYAARKSRKASR